MQRLVNSAKTRFGPATSQQQYQDPTSSSSFYQEGQDYFEQSHQQNQVRQKNDDHCWGRCIAYSFNSY